jgi:hypothetical protein
MYLLIHCGYGGLIEAKITHPVKSVGKLSARLGIFFFVVYTEQEEGIENVTRLISAREAEKHERRSYNGYYQINSKGWTKDT